MGDNVSRQAVLSILNGFEVMDGHMDQQRAIHMVELLPSTDRPKSEWKEVGSFEDEIGVRTYVLWCQNCGALHRVRKLCTGEYVNAEYCPHCGADMRGVDDESTL